MVAGTNQLLRCTARVGEGSEGTYICIHTPQTHVLFRTAGATPAFIG